MKLTLTFETGDFKDMRAFEKAVQRQVGNNVYVGTDNMCLYFEFPPELRDKLRPSVARYLKPVEETLTVEVESSKTEAR